MALHISQLHQSDEIRHYRISSWGEKKIPFEEIGRKVEIWVAIHDRSITLSKGARTYFFEPYGSKEYRKVRLFWDKEKNLFGFQPSATGYTINKDYGRLRCRQIPTDVPQGKFHASWDEELEMLITSFVSF